MKHATTAATGSVRELDHDIHIRAVRRAVWGIARPRTTTDDRAARDPATQERR